MREQNVAPLHHLSDVGPDAAGVTAQDLAHVTDHCPIQLGPVDATDCAGLISQGGNEGRLREQKSVVFEHRLHNLVCRHEHEVRAQPGHAFVERL